MSKDKKKPAKRLRVGREVTLSKLAAAYKNRAPVRPLKPRKKK